MDLSLRDYEEGEGKRHRERRLCSLVNRAQRSKVCKPQIPFARASASWFGVRTHPRSLSSDPNVRQNPNDHKQYKRTGLFAKFFSSSSYALLAFQGKKIQMDPTPKEQGFKVILIGNSGVGKSALTLRYSDNAFFEDHAMTLGVDFKYVDVDSSRIGGHAVKLQIWDTAGQDTFLSVTTQYYRGCNGVVLCYDLTRRSSFDALDLWYTRLRERIDPKSVGEMPPCLLIGCKLDIVSSSNEINPSIVVGKGSSQACPRAVSVEEAKAWAKQHEMSYIETSAKTSVNVAAGFEHITRQMLERLGPAGISPPLPFGGGMTHRRKASVSLTEENPKKEGNEENNGGGACARC